MRQVISQAPFSLIFKWIYGHLSMMEMRDIDIPGKCKSCYDLIVSIMSVCSDITLIGRQKLLSFQVVKNQEGNLLAKK